MNSNVHVKNSHSSGPIPIFDGSNYTSWRLHMQNHLEGASIYNIIDQCFSLMLDDKNHIMLEERNMAWNAQA